MAIKSSGRTRGASKSSHESSDPPIAQSRPETFRLPKPGANDPYFGITRPGYYQGERAGWWTLIRLKQPGKTRGTTLIPFDEVAAFIQKRRMTQTPPCWGGPRKKKGPL